jgi:hypothetical protein
VRDVEGVFHDRKQTSRKFSAPRDDCVISTRCLFDLQEGRVRLLPRLSRTDPDNAVLFGGRKSVDTLPLAERDEKPRNLCAAAIGTKLPPVIRALQGVIIEASSERQRNIAVRTTIEMSDRSPVDPPIEDELSTQNVHLQR